MEQDALLVDRFGRPWPPRFKVISDQHAARLRAMTPTQRLEGSSQMFCEVRDRIVPLVREEHPEWTPVQVTHEFYRRLDVEGYRDNPEYISDRWEREEQSGSRPSGDL